MCKFRFFLFAFFVFTFSVFSFAQEQSSEKESEESLQRQAKLVEQILSDANVLKLPENHAVIFAQVGSYLCKSDEKRAVQLFQKSIGELNSAQQEVENMKKGSPNLEQLIYGQSPRFTILETIAACDPEIALELLYKSRPARISQMMTQDSAKLASRKYYLDTEFQYEQRFMGLAAEKNPDRAVELLSENLKKGVTYETLNLLYKIYAKDPKTAEKLAEEVVGKLLNEALSDDDYQKVSTLQYFLESFAAEKTSDQKTLTISDALIRNLADKVSAFSVAKDYGLTLETNGFKTIEKYFPDRAAKIKKKQTQNEDKEAADYNKLVESDLPPEEMLKKAESFQTYRDSIYNTVVQKMAQNGNTAEAVNVINSKFSGEEAEQQLSSFYYNLASQEISKENYELANNYINQIPQEQNRFNALLDLARTVSQKNEKENKQQALSILYQAYALIETSEITQQEMTNLIEIANVYAATDPPQAFRIIESIVPTTNELTRAYAVISQFKKEPIQREGEFLIENSGSLSGAYNLGASFQTLKDKDFDRTLQLINNFERLETRLTLRLEIIKSLVNAAAIKAALVQVKKP